MRTAGGSAAVIAVCVVTPFQVMAKRAGSVVRVSYAQWHPAPDNELPTVPSRYFAPASGGGQGLTARYYNGKTLSGPAVATRVDPDVGGNWHDRPPAPDERKPVIGQVKPNRNRSRHGRVYLPACVVKGLGVVVAVVWTGGPVTSDDGRRCSPTACW